MEDISPLIKEACDLAERPIDVVQTKDGKHIVLFMALNEPPPPKGDTIKEAIEKFIEYMKARPKKDLPVVDFTGLEEI